MSSPESQQSNQAAAVSLASMALAAAINSATRLQGKAIDRLRLHHAINKHLALLETTDAFNWEDHLRLVAIEAGEKMKTLIRDGNNEALINYSSLGKAFDLAIPSPEHFLPLLYTLALKEPEEGISFFNDRPVMGSLTMTSALIGSP